MLTREAGIEWVTDGHPLDTLVLGRVGDRQRLSEDWIADGGHPVGDLFMPVLCYIVRDGKLRIAWITYACTRHPKATD